MKQKGAGYVHEMLMGVFFLILVMTFYMKDSQQMMAPILLLLGAGFVVGGFVTREPMIVAGGFAILGVALMYNEVFMR
jgi:hypothetical protein